MRTLLRMGLKRFKTFLESTGMIEGEPETIEVAPRPVVHSTLPPAPSSVSVNSSSLSKLMAEVNSAAPAKYFQYQDMLARMSKIIGMNEDAQRQAAAAAVGISDAEIAAAVDALIQRLAQEESEYSTTVNAAMQEQVISKREQVDALKRQVAELEAEISESTTAIQSGAGTFKQMVNQARTEIEKFDPRRRTS